MRSFLVAVLALALGSLLAYVIDQWLEPLLS